MTAVPPRSLDEIVDRCIDDITAGRRTVAECLAAYPRHRDALAPLLEAAAAVQALPRVPERAPDPARRTAFMAELARTPQQSRRTRPHLRLPRFDGPRGFGGFGGFRGRLLAFATVAAPAAAVAAVALVLVLGGRPAPASASTLTVFAGGVEQERDGAWLPLADGEAVAQGARLRTTADGRAMITFADGSTATLSPTTELVLERVHVDGTRSVIIDQRSGRLWNDVVPDLRAGAQYVVRTNGVVTTVTGTVFETAVDNGEIAVTTASGTVNVTAGEDAVDVDDGETVRATSERIQELAVVRPAAAVRIDAPYTASLIASDGTATGARPDGVTFSQIAGAATTDPAAGPQRIDLLRTTPGDYTLVLRPFADGSGVVVIDVGGEVMTIPVTGAEDVYVQLRIAEIDGRQAIEVLDRDDVQSIVDAARERVVDTRRTTDAVSVAVSRAAAAAAQASAATATPAPTTPARERADDDGAPRGRDDARTDGANGDDDRDDRDERDDRSERRDDRSERRDDDTPDGLLDRVRGRLALPNATQTPALNVARARLRAALAARDERVLARVVNGLLAEDAALSHADAVALLVAEGLRTRTSTARLRTLVASESDAGARLRAALGDAAVGELGPAIDRLLDGASPLVPPATPEPGGTGERQRGTATETTTPVPVAPRRGLPRLGPATATPTATPAATATATAGAEVDGDGDGDDDGDDRDGDGDDDRRGRRDARDRDDDRRDGTSSGTADRRSRRDLRGTLADATPTATPAATPTADPGGLRPLIREVAQADVADEGNLPSRARARADAVADDAAAERRDRERDRWWWERARRARR